MRGYEWRLPFAAAMLVAPVVAVAQAPSTQQQFESGSAALGEGRWAEALAILEPLEKRIRNERSRAIVQVRMGEALYNLKREAEAAAMISLGLAQLPKDDPTLREDIYLALRTLGDLGTRALDYASAHARYSQAEQFADAPLSKIRALAGVVQTGTFVDVEAALTDAERLIALADTQGNAQDKQLLASLQILKGRALLNLGRFKEAQAMSAKAVANLGGADA